MHGYNLLQSIFSSSQILTIVLVSVVLAMLIALNAVLMYQFHKRGERRLCTHQLQHKRDELLDRLEYIKNGGEIDVAVSGWMYPEEEEAQAEVDEGDEDEPDDDNDDDEEDKVIGESLDEVPEEVSESNDTYLTYILAVRDMSAGTREILGFAGEEYDRKQYYVRYTLGFEAKLREADDVIKERYKELVNEIMLYKGVKIKSSFKQQRITKGRKTIGLIMFRGKTLCIAFALNPADYAETKYRGIDKSDKKRFAVTPMLYKLTSARRLEYAKYLLIQLADENTIVLNEHPVLTEIDLDDKTRDELFLEKKLRIRIIEEAQDIEDEAEDETEDSEEELADEISEEIIEEEITSAADEVVKRRVIYNRSFTARIIQANDELKARYSELKNYILNYHNVLPVISWKRESFRYGRKNVLSFAIIGKTLCLYLAADPEKVVGKKYGAEDVSQKRSSGNTPVMLRIKSDRRTKYAKELIDIVLIEQGSEKSNRKPADYTTPYKATATLIRKGLIRERIIEGEPPLRKDDGSLNISPNKEKV